MARASLYALLLVAAAAALLVASASAGDHAARNVDGGVAVQEFLCSAPLNAWYDSGGAGGNYIDTVGNAYLFTPDNSQSAEITISFQFWFLMAGDVLNVYDGASSSAPLLGTMDVSTNGLETSFTSSRDNGVSGQMYVEFVPNNDGMSQMGWIGAYLCAGVNDYGVMELCDQEFYDSGGADGDYPIMNGGFEKWTLEAAEEGEIVIANFTSLEMEDQFDLLHVYDCGCTEPEYLIASLTGSMSDFVVKTTENNPDNGTMTLVMESDQGNTEAGWHADILCDDRCLFETTPPELTHPEGINGEQCPPSQLNRAMSPGKCFAAVSYFHPQVTDNCAGAILFEHSDTFNGTFTDLPIEGVSAAYELRKGLHNLAYQATDVIGNTGGCSFAIEVTDQEDPTIVCPSNINQNTNGACSAQVFFTTPFGQDNCPGVYTVKTFGLDSGDIFPVGATLEKFAAIDNSENVRKTDCEFTVTVVDADPPVIVCPPNMSISNDAGQCHATGVTYTAPVGTDNCPDTSTSQTAGLLPDGSQTYPMGVTQNSYMATDTAAMSASCTFTVTVTDTEAPAVTCPADIDTTADGNCEAMITFDFSFDDNCAGSGAVNNGDQLTSGATYTVGEYMADFVVTDGAGNTTPCTFAVSIVDDSPPSVLSCPTDIGPIATDTGDCSAEVTFTVDFADNCQGQLDVALMSGMASGSAFPTGTTAVSYTATDAGGNTAECSFSVTVVDGQEPAVFDCPGAQQMNNDVGKCSAVADWTMPGATDQCDGGLAPSSNDSPALDDYPVGTSDTTFVWTDAAGNSATCSFQVTVTDTEDPVPSCPADVELLTSVTGECGGSTEDRKGDFSSDDNCAVSSAVFSCEGCMVPVRRDVTMDTLYHTGAGTDTVTYTAMDAAGNSAACSISVTVTDDVYPTIACPASQTVDNEHFECYGMWEGDWPENTAIADDDCGFDESSMPVIYSSDSLGEFFYVDYLQEQFPIGETTLYLSVPDKSGNVATCSFSITVNDVTCTRPGCMDTAASNFDPDANAGDQVALCEYLGCMDPEADNYDAQATSMCEMDTETEPCCLYTGCMDPLAGNYKARNNVGCTVFEEFPGQCSEIPDKVTLRKVMRTIGKDYDYTTIEEYCMGMDMDEGGVDNTVIKRGGDLELAVCETCCTYEGCFDQIADNYIGSCAVWLGVYYPCEDCCEYSPCYLHEQNIERFREFGEDADWMVM